MSRTRSYWVWAFLISIGLHFIVGVLFPYKRYAAKPDPPQRLAIETRLRVVAPTPKPTNPPPTPPPPRNTPPPSVAPTARPAPHLLIRPVALRPDSRGHDARGERPYVDPHEGSEDGAPEPAPRGTPAAPSEPIPIPSVASVSPTPSPLPRPLCSNPNADAMLIRGVAPEYPELARQRGAAGATQVKVTLDARGFVAGASVYRSSGNASLDEAALIAARASSYSAAIENCSRVGGSYLFRAEFNAE